MYTLKKMQNNNNNQMYIRDQLHMDGNASPNDKKNEPFVINCPQIVFRPFCRLVICCARIPCMEEIIEPFYCCLWQNYWYYTLCGDLVIRDTSGMTGGSSNVFRRASTCKIMRINRIMCIMENRAKKYI